MPRVPGYSRQIQEGGLPNARFTPSSNIESFGGGQSFQKVTNAATQFIQNKMQEADDIATTEAYANAVKAKNDLIYNPETGAMTRTGKNAIGSVESYTDQYNSELDNIGKGLANDRQRMAFNKIRLQQTSELYSTLQRHEFQEHAKYDQETTKTAITASMDDAIKNYQNPGKISESISTQIDAIERHGKRSGLPPESIKQQKQRAVSATHSGIIGRMLDNGQDQLAKAYYEEAKKDITGEDASKIEKSLEVGTLRGDAQRKTDEIMEKASTLTEGLSLARAIKDPTLRDEVVSRVKNRFSELKGLEKQELDQSYLKAYEYVSQNPNRNPIDVIPPSVFSKLSSDQKRAIYNIQTPGTDDANTWISFTSLSSREMASLSLSDLQTQYWSGMNESHRKQATDLWYTSKRNVDDAKVNGFLSEKATIKNSLISSGYYDIEKPSEEQKKRLVQFESFVDKKYQEFERTKGRKPYPEEFQKMVDEELTRKVFVDKFWSNPKQLALEVSEDDRGKVFIPYKQVPQIAIDRIKTIAKQRGITVTKSKIEQIYGASVMGDDERVEELLR